MSQNDISQDQLTRTPLSNTGPVAQPKMNGFDWRQAWKVLTTTIAGLFIIASAAQEPERSHTIPFFPSASDEVREGFARVINHSAEAGEVRIDAVDDEGESYGAVMLAIDAGEAAHFNSDDLENGNAAKGLSGSVEADQGDWRLQLSSELDIEVLSYIRTSDGFVTAMHDTVPSEGGRHRVVFFNPGSNDSQVSRLRLVNPGDEAAAVSTRPSHDHELLLHQLGLKLPEQPAPRLSV